jgi:hypothetical protein
LERCTKKSLPESTTGRKTDKFGTVNDRVNEIVVVQFGEVEDKMSSFDEEDLSSSYFSTADSRR